MNNYKDFLEMKSTTHDNEVLRFLYLLENKVPFSFARFNDGEMAAIGRTGGIIARGDQVFNEDMQGGLEWAIKHRQENYWIGKICSTCWPKMKELSDSFFPDYYPYSTRACAITNRNWLKFIQGFPETVKGRRIYWIGGNDQKLYTLPFYTNIVPALFNNKNSWGLKNTILSLFNFEKGDVVMFSIGPLGRFLAAEFFKRFPRTTFMDVGSTFDPFTRNVWHNCHKGWENGKNLVKECKECN